MIVIITIYGFLRSVEMMEYGETDIMISSRDAYFDADFVLSDGLRFAYGLTDFDSGQDPIDDPSYGNLVAYTRSWGVVSATDTTF